MRYHGGFKRTCCPCVSALTGLQNRWAFDVSLADWRGHDFALMLIDIDHFKQINDELGHREGDRVLASVAKAISSTLRGDDAAFRYGGEEFAVLASGANRVA